MPPLHKYSQLSNAERNAAGDFHSSYFEPSDTPTHAGGSSRPLQASEYLEPDFISHLLGSRLASMTSIFFNREVRAFMARVCSEETLDSAALDCDGIEPDGFRAAAFVPFKVSKVKADAGVGLISSMGLRASSPMSEPIQPRFLDRDAVNDNHWRSAA